MDLNSKNADLATILVLRIGVPICVAGILWIAQTISRISDDQIKSQEWRSMVVDQMRAFSIFMKAPRFTHSDFNNLIIPLTQKVDSNKDAISDIKLDLKQVSENTRLISVIETEHDAHHP